MRSDQIKKGFERAPHRALLRATGVKENDFSKPFIAIVNSYVDIIPGHVHLQAFGKRIKEAVRAAGGVPFEFNTIGVDDGIAMGHLGMKFSLPARELIADKGYDGDWFRQALAGRERAQDRPLGELVGDHDYRRQSEPGDPSRHRCAARPRRTGSPRSGRTAPGARGPRRRLRGSASNVRTSRAGSE